MSRAQYKICPVVLSGGSGTRLWPLSRELHPKQLLALVGEQTLLQQTVLRLLGLDGVTDPLIVCNEEHRFMVAEQMRQIEVTPAAILLEPLARNTAPAVAVAAAAAADRYAADTLLLVLPADHVVADPDALHEAVRKALPAAAAGHLVTFGITPTRPETGYGYIRAGDATGVSPDVCAVAEFVEKPEQATAEKYLAHGGYYWNSGMFLFRASRYLEELGRFQPEMLEACRNAYAAARRDLDFQRLDKAHFARSPSDSIDYAVMERTAQAAVVPLDAGWNDVGTWSALYDVNDKDDDDNVCLGDVHAVDSSGCYLYADHRLLAVLDVHDLVIVETADAVLIAPRGKVQEVKKVVDRLRRERRREVELHREVYRPWGAADAIATGERYEVKHLTIRPGGSQSLQMHRHRAEHWVVVRGTANVICDDESFELSENQSTYIPVGSKHRIANPGTAPLEIIEIQTGSHIDEDDIVRFEDTYGRASESDE